MEVAVIGFLTVIAAGVGTLTGFGTSTILVPVVVLFLPLPKALLLVGVIHWFGDIWKMALFRTGINWRLIVAFGIPGLVASFLGARTVFAFPETALSRILGVFLLGYALLLLIKSGWQVKASTPSAVFGGGLSGFLAGFFGIGGAVRGAFLAGYNLPKAVYIATAGAIGLAVDTVRLGTYWQASTRLESTLLWGLLLFIPASFLGAELAKRFVRRIPQAWFRMVIATALLLIGLKLLWWA